MSKTVDNNKTIEATGRVFYIIYDCFNITEYSKETGTYKTPTQTKR